MDSIFVLLDSLLMWKKRRWHESNIDEIRQNLPNGGPPRRAHPQAQLKLFHISLILIYEQWISKMICLLLFVPNPRCWMFRNKKRNLINLWTAVITRVSSTSYLDMFLQLEVCSHLDIYRPCHSKIDLVDNQLPAPELHICIYTVLHPKIEFQLQI